MLVYDRRFLGSNLSFENYRRTGSRRVVLATHDFQRASRPLVPLQAGHIWPEDGDWSTEPSFELVGPFSDQRCATAKTLAEPWGVRPQPGGRILLSRYLDHAELAGLMVVLDQAPEPWSLGESGRLIAEALGVPHVNYDAEAFAIHRQRMQDWRDLIDQFCGAVSRDVAAIHEESNREAVQRERLVEWLKGNL